MTNGFVFELDIRKIIVLIIASSILFYYIGFELGDTNGFYRGYDNGEKSHCLDYKVIISQLEDDYEDMRDEKDNCEWELAGKPKAVGLENFECKTVCEEIL